MYSACGTVMLFRASARIGTTPLPACRLRACYAHNTHLNPKPEAKHYSLYCLCFLLVLLYSPFASVMIPCLLPHNMHLNLKP